MTKAPYQHSASAMVNRLDGLSALALYTAYLATEDRRARELLYTYVTRWQNLRSSITGDDLRARGVPPGPIYAQILTTLRNAWLDGEITSPEQEAELLVKILEEYSKGQRDDVSGNGI